MKFWKKRKQKGEHPEKPSGSSESRKFIGDALEARVLYSAAPAPVEVELPEPAVPDTSERNGSGKSSR